MGPSQVIQTAPVDLTNCDREPIHIPGSIQPHGVLLAVTEPELIVVQASTNTAELLGVEHGAVLGARLLEVLEAPTLVIPPRCAGAPSVRHVNAAPLTVRGRAFDGILHRSGGLLVLELEPASDPAFDTGATSDFYDLVHEWLGHVDAVQQLSDLWPTLAAVVRDLSGFDRVMIYRFDEQDGSGEVIAEQRCADMDPYLGLHYPASDVPSQARRLYEQNRLRLICDAAYTPAAILPADNPLTGGPLDLSGAVLRSVSPIHCEYLGNMGVRASMSVSLIKDEKLWGLIACHHRVPRFVPYQKRILCELVGDVVSWMLGPGLEAEQSRARVRANVAVTQIVEAISTQSDIVTGLVDGPPSVLDLVNARGFAVVYEGRITTRGTTPSPERLEDLVAWLEEVIDGATYATDALSAAYAPAAAFEDKASGLLGAAVSKAERILLLWFRPEAIREVQWAGNPTKAVEIDAQRISPRRSFARWEETVHGRSLPWQAWEIGAATDLRRATSKVILQRKAELLNIELQRAVQSREEFLSMASHELKTPTTTLRLQLEALRRMIDRAPIAPEKLRARVAKADRQVARLEVLINQLLDVSRIAAGRIELERTSFDLADLAREVVDRFADVGVAIRVDAGGDLRGSWDRFRLDQVLTNLISNAIKYGRGSPVDVTLRAAGDSVRCAVRDRGIGIPTAAQEKIFERFERAAPLPSFAGFGLGLWIARQIVERHAGTIQVESEPGEGSTFRIDLPRGSTGEE